MKLCITSTGKDLQAQVDNKFGRAPYFFLVDTETLTSEAATNSASSAGQGAGIRAAQTLTDRKLMRCLPARSNPMRLKRYRRQE